MPADSASSALARSLIRDVSTASLATLTAEGWPFASYVTAAARADGSPLLLLSRLAVHTQNIARDSRASMLFVREPDPRAKTMTAERLTLVGRIVAEADQTSRDVFLKRHPDAAAYAGFADFALYRFEIAGGHLVAGFGRIVGLTPADLLGV
jgi:putative heme iron utilization protein